MNPKIAEVVALLSEAIEDLRNIGCDDLADSFERRLEQSIKRLEQPIEQVEK
jgi:hypothetical protein